MEVKGVAKRKGGRREAEPERSVERTREPMDKNRIEAIRAGRGDR
jgi:hypothetical protein